MYVWLDSMHAYWDGVYAYVCVLGVIGVLQI